MNKTGIFTCSGCKQGAPSTQGHDGSISDQFAAEIESSCKQLLILLNDLDVGNWCVYVEQSFSSFHFVCEREDWLRKSTCFDFLFHPLITEQLEQEARSFAIQCKVDWKYRHGTYNYPLPMIVESDEESFWG